MTDSILEINEVMVGEKKITTQMIDFIDLNNDKNGQQMPDEIKKVHSRIEEFS